MAGKVKSFDIEQMLLNKIESGEYPHNAFLPSENELARVFHAARNTVRKALAALEQRGLLIKGQGRSSRVNYPKTVHKQPEHFLAWMWYQPLTGLTENIVYFEMFQLMVELARDEKVGIKFFDIGPHAGWTPAVLDTPRCIGCFSVGITSDRIDRGVLEQLKKIPRLISIDEAGAPLGACVVSIDNYASGKLAATHLLHDCQYRKIAIINTDGEQSMPFRERISGFCDAAREYPDVSIEFMTFDRHLHLPESASARQDFLHFHRHLDAIFCLTDLLALNMLDSAGKLGIRVPEELAVMGFDGIYTSQHITPHLTTVAQPNGKVIRAALDLALAQYRNPGMEPPSSIKYTGKVLCGETTRIRVR